MEQKWFYKSFVTAFTIKTRPRMVFSLLKPEFSCTSINWFHGFLTFSDREGSLVAEWRAKTCQNTEFLIFFLIVRNHGSCGQIAKEHKFKETKDVTPTRDKVSSERRLFSKMNFVTCRSTYHSSCYRIES